MKKIIIILVIITVIGGGVFFALQKFKQGPEYTTVAVERGTLKQTVEATGKVESAERIELNFKTTGRLSDILVKVGDQVKKDQELAKLDAQALASKVSDAQAKLNQALADYEKILAGSSAEDIRVAEDTVAQKLEALNAAKNDLANLKSKRDTELQNYKEAAIVALNSELVTAQGALEEIDNTLNDSDAQATLSIKDTSALNRAELSQETAINAVDESEMEINLINNDSADSQVFDALDNLNNNLNKVAIALSDTLDVLTATIVSNDLTEAELDALKTNIKTDQTAVATSKSDIQTAKSNWTNKIATYQDSITGAEDDVVAAEAALQVASSQLALEKAGPRLFEIRAGAAKVDQAQAALTLAQANLAETIIKAPLDGTIIQKNYEVGEQTSLTTPVLEMIGQSNLEIEVDIPESDIAKVQVGQEVDITLDAFTDDDIFPGSVTFVDPAETVIQDVVYYQVKVQFTDKQNNVKSIRQAQDILPGMTANTTICTNKKDNVLYVPARAVRSKNDEKYVEVLTDGTAKEPVVTEKIVTTGMRGDEGIEIISGLQEGEEIVTFVKNGN